MNTPVITVEDTLRADGTLELDQMPNVSPGRVTVILQPAATRAPVQHTLASVIDEIRLGQQARGFQGRSAEEIEAALDEGEDVYEQRMDSLR
ncbi:MAG: hypothetical protein B7Z73_13700 [Planctomycetia bacterium 21-64-5]|nr:MAG: hypothetical protein B7Z73_13700 [Planctomycetia bacterium 21-64-5]HQU45362.1 hypothetical protein [Pirellulales bacterium]